MQTASQFPYKPSLSRGLRTSSIIFPTLRRNFKSSYVLLKFFFKDHKSSLTIVYNWNQCVTFLCTNVGNNCLHLNLRESLQKGAFQESNSGPLTPKARITPLDQMPCYPLYLLESQYVCIRTTIRLEVSFTTSHQ